MSGAKGRSSAMADRPKRITVADIAARKGGTPIVCLTAYTTPIARLLDDHADFLLVGDSLGMVLYGLPDTLAVSLEMMIGHGAAVVRGTRRALVVVDLPFGAYQASPDQAFRAAARVMAETGCAAVKLEGGAEMAPTIEFLVARGIPVVGHVGLMPQKVHALGGFKAQGRGGGAETVLADARAVAEAGAFCLVLEAVVAPLAERVTRAVPVPVIGIGASAECDGQILVTDDMLGLLGPGGPKFVKRYADLAPRISEAAAAYADEVRTRAFPGPDQLYRE